MGGVNASVESLTLTYSDLGNVIQVKVNYTNGESSTIRQRSTDLRNLFGLPSIRFTINGAGGGARFPLRREPERGRAERQEPPLHHQRNRSPEPGGPG